MLCSVRGFFEDCPTKAEHLGGKIEEFLAQQCGSPGTGAIPTAGTRPGAFLILFTLV
jgi:hypothetical protein